mgnify:CR=1 FL=1
MCFFIYFFLLGEPLPPFDFPFLVPFFLPEPLLLLVLLLGGAPEIDGVQLTGYATLLFFDLREDLIDLYPQFIAALRWFDTGTGMACVTSMIARPYTGSHASMADEEKTNIGLTQQLVRLSIGLENTQDLIEDLSQAFEAIGVRQGL